jgi:hypothetical protein
VQDRHSFRPLLTGGYKKMALDIHIGKDEEDAEKKLPEYSIELNIHETIFYRTPLPQKKLKLVYRFKDYWSDSHFLPEELPILMKELSTLKKSFSQNPQLIKVLSGISEACAKAHKSSENVWFFCD